MGQKADMDLKGVVRRLAPHVVAAIEAGDHWSLDWGMVPHTSGRVFVRMFRLWISGPKMVEVRLDRAPVWRSCAISDWGVEWDDEIPIGWLDDHDRLSERQREQAWNRSRQAQRDADRAAVIEAIREGRLVVYNDGQEWGTLAVPVPAQSRHVVGSCCAPNKFEVIWAVASARGLYRALTGGTAGDQNWSCWLAEVTNPPAPVRPLPRRQRRDPVAFDIAAG
jgi:hypothetical protein